MATLSLPPHQTTRLELVARRRAELARQQVARQQVAPLPHRLEAQLVAVMLLPRVTAPKAALQCLAWLYSRRPQSLACWLLAPWPSLCKVLVLEPLRIVDTCKIELVLYICYIIHRQEFMPSSSRARLRSLLSFFVFLTSLNFRLIVMQESEPLWRDVLLDALTGHPSLYGRI